MNDETVQVNHPVEPAIMELAGKVGQRSALKGMRLLSLNVKLGQLAEGDPTLARLGHRHRFGRLAEEDQLQLTCSFRFELAYDEASKTSPVALIQATYGLVYKTTGLAKLDDTELDAFAQVNGPFNAWPFWRELVHSTLGRMGLPPVAIPTFRMSAAPKELPSATADTPVDPT